MQRQVPKWDPKDEAGGKKGKKNQKLEGHQVQILIRVPLARIRKKGKMRSWKEALKVWMWVMLSAL